MIEHHRGSKEQGDRIGNAFACDVRRRTMDGFKNGGVLADIGSWRHAEAANQAGDLVRKDVAEQVRCH